MTVAASSPAYAAGDANLAQGHEAYASSESTGTVAADAVDGDLATAWSPTADDQGRWLTVELSAQARVSEIVLDWGTQAPASLFIKTSPSVRGVIWNQTLVPTTAGTSGEQVIDVAQTAQPVGSIRIYVSGPCSLQEFKVFGTAR